MNHIQAGRGRRVMASIALFAATACGGDSTGTGAPDDPGVLLATNVVGPYDLVWTRDGGEVVYARATSLNAVSVATQVERHLVADATISITGIASAGDWIYYGAVVTPPPPAAVNFRVSRINPATGAAQIVLTIPYHGSDYVVVSADERFIAAEGGIYNLQAGTKVDFSCNKARGFSPDATQLLCQVPFGSGTQASFALISTSDGTVQQLPATNAVGFYFGLRWVGNSPQLLAYAVDNRITRIYEIDGVTGATRDVVQLGGNVTLLLLANWSQDGRTLGAWIDPSSGQDRKANLYIVRTGSAAAVAARVSSNPFASFPSVPVLSANGSSVAYFYYNENNNRSLYAKTGI